MRAVYQRVKRASVSVEGKVVSAIDAGLLLLVGVTTEDGPAEATLLAEKIAHFRMFTDENDKLNLSVLDTGGSVLAVSQFTLCANTSHGRRPDFLRAARPEHAQPLFDLFVQKLREVGVGDVQTGAFGADMQVELVNDGPVTLILDTDEWRKRK
ncbi:MAG: D-tyrosyl-tRNA(Tyr) deacylase [Clostridia bacterium]|nr:D-tyrosyl-tRNA(Tyr) deacylase [Clostridia bacterium]